MESNLEYVNVQEHAAIHYERWVYCGDWEDEIAWKSLSKQISLDEIRRLKASYANKGKKVSQQTRKKLSLSNLGKQAGILNPFYGKTHSQKTKQKIKEKRANQITTLATIQKMSNAHIKRYIENPSIKIRISNKMLGANNHFFGKTHSDETKNKLRQKRLGSKLPEETKEKIRQSWAKRKGFQNERI